MKRVTAFAVLVVLLVPALAYAVPQITGADVVDDSLTGADIQEPTLAKVPFAGHADTAGSASVEITSRQSEYFDVSPGAVASRSAACPSGWVPTGGGFEVFSFAGGLTPVQSAQAGHSWSVAMVNNGNTTQRFKVVVMCAEGVLVD